MNFFLRFLLLVPALLLIQTAAHAQVVGLDNWFNHETRDGKPFHYLWNDSADSGYSKWGKIFADNGAKLKTLERPTSAVLKNINIYIIVDPDTTKENPSPNYIAQNDIKQIVQWVKRGGVLIILANDAPNCEFTHLNNLTSNFGIIFNHVSLKPVTGKNWEMGAFKNLGAHPVFKGVSKIYMKEVSSLSLSKDAKPVLKENDQVFMAESRVGKGWVFAIGDPWIYNEYMDNERLTPDFENRKAAENLTKYLIVKSKGK